MHEGVEITTRSGVRLHVERWSPPPGRPIRFVVVLSHGAAEHVGRYDQLAGWLVDQGGLVFGADHRGQGLSGGPAGHVDRFSDYCDDLDEVIAAACHTLPPAALPDEARWFLYGQGMGGLVVLTYLLLRGDDHPFAGAIVSAPLLGLAAPVPAYRRRLAAILGRIWPRLRLPTGLPVDALSRERRVVAAFRADRRRVDKVSARWFKAMHEAAARARADAPSLTLPMLWMVGGADRICDPEATRAVFDALPAAADHDQTMKIFDGYFHELHHEPELLQRPVRDLVVGWIQRRAGDR
ncbi:MAG: alpha/beta hydrolase [Nannocystaceae bacterium]